MMTEYQFLTRPQLPRRKTAAPLWRIGGETLTMDEIAKRLGISKGTVQSRMYKLRHASGAITFERLAAMGEAA